LIAGVLATGLAVLLAFSYRDLLYGFYAGVPGVACIVIGAVLVVRSRRRPADTGG
jgi:hypothetical protein